MRFSANLGIGVLGGGSPKGLENNLLVQIFALGSCKMQFAECYFCFTSWPLTRTNQGL